MAKSPDEMAAAMVANMKEKTGKSIDQWLEIAAGSSYEKHGELVTYLKTEHGMTHGFANLVAHKHFKSDASESGGDDLIADQYAGPKAELKSVYDAVIEAVTKFGKDIDISPKKSYVSLRRSKQFAIIQPSTKTRIDIGINLKGHESTERLEDSGSFNAMVSHRVRVTNLKQVDKELIGWLKKAYETA